MYIFHVFNSWLLWSPARKVMTDQFGAYGTPSCIRLEDEEPNPKTIKDPNSDWGEDMTQFLIMNHSLREAAGVSIILAEIMGAFTCMQFAKIDHTGI